MCFNSSKNNGTQVKPVLLLIVYCWGDHGMLLKIEEGNPYLTRHIPEADYEKIIACRKKHLFKANAMKIGFWLFLIAMLIYNIYTCCV